MVYFFIFFFILVSISFHNTHTVGKKRGLQPIVTRSYFFNKTLLQAFLLSSLHINYIQSLSRKVHSIFYLSDDLLIKETLYKVGEIDITNFRYYLKSDLGYQIYQEVCFFTR